MASRKRKRNRLLAMLLTLCLIIGNMSGLALVAAAEAKTLNDTSLHFIVRHWHAAGGDVDTTPEKRSVTIEGYYYEDGSVKFVKQGETELVESLDGAQKEDDQIKIPVAPLTESTSAGSAATIEEFTGFSVTAGHEAVTTVENEKEKNQSYLTIQYDAGVHLVKVDIFYKNYNDIVKGEEFKNAAGSGSDEAYNNEEDTKIKSGEKVYNTSKGLHTDKNASSVGSGGRTYDLTLESWFAGTKSVDVGMILDASGSMSFTSQDLQPINLADKYGSVEAAKEALGIDTMQYMSLETVNKILDSNYTDNSKLGFGNYSYFVYDKRDGTKEFVPIGYWEGETVTVESEPDFSNLPQADKLLGYYGFNGNLNNGVSNSGKAVIVDQPKSNQFSDTDNGKNAKYAADGLLDSKQSLKIQETAVKNGAVMLDVAPTKNEFTLAFAVKRENTLETDKTTFTDILYIGDTDYSKSNYYTVTRQNHSAKQRLKFRENAGLSEQKDIVNANKIYEKDQWEIVTYVVKGDQVTFNVYNSDGSSSPDTGLNGGLPYTAQLSKELSYKDLKIILGGILGTTESVVVDENPTTFTHEMKLEDNNEVYLDELYVYDTALNETEIKELVDAMKGKSKKSLTERAITTARGSGEIMGTTNSDDFKTSVETQMKALEGWYYVSSGSTWKEYTSNQLATAKSYRGMYGDEIVFNEIKKDNLPESVQTYLTDKGIDPETSNGKLVDGTRVDGFIYTGSDDLKVDEDWCKKYSDIDQDKVIAQSGVLSIPKGVTRQKVNNKYSSPIIFFMDESGMLRCFYNTGSSQQRYKDNKDNLTWDRSQWNRDRSDCSYVYWKADEQQIKTEDLQYALGSFISNLNEASPDSRVAAVRFSTDNLAKDDYKDEKAEYNKLVLQNWTTNTLESISMLGLNRGDGSAAGYDKDEEAAEAEYNYGMTGGTHTWTGLTAYDKYLKEGARKDNSANRHLIIFTDGKDDNLGGSSDENVEAAKKIANELKKEGYTIYCVMFTSAGFSTSDISAAKEFLGALASKEEYVYEVTDVNTLVQRFNEDILSNIVDNLEGYSVQDYIDPRFNLVDGNGEIVELLANGTVHYDGKTYKIAEDGSVTDETGASVAEAGTGLKIRVTKTVDAANGGIANLLYDTAQKMYYLKWVDQTIPGCSVGASELQVWRTVVQVTAKDDLIGGDEILTNGNSANQNMVYYETKGETPSSGTTDTGFSTGSDSYPSKGFPRPQVNVSTLDPNLTDGKDHIFMGETVTPKDLLEELTKQDSPYLDYLKRYAENTGTTVEALLQEILEAGSSGKTYNYSYLPDDGTNPSNQTGTENHEKDVLGKLTFKWEPIDDTPDETDPYTANDTKDKKYKFSVSYDPASETDRDNANKNNVIGSEDSDYNTPKKAVGNPAEKKEETVTHETDIVSGEVILEMQVAKSDIEKLFETTTEDEVTFTYTADVYRDGTKIGEVTVTKTFKEDDLSSLGDTVSVFGSMTFTDSSFDYAKNGLPQGTYKFEENTDETKLPSQFTFDNFEVLGQAAVGENEGQFNREVYKPESGKSAGDYAAPFENSGKNKELYLGSQEKGGPDYLEDRLGMLRITARLQAGDLVISKKVVNEITAPDNTAFTFSLKLGSAGSVPEGSYRYTLSGDGADRTGTIGIAADGTVTIDRLPITLKDGESLTISGLPHGTVYTVEEEQKAGYTSNLEGTVTGQIDGNGTQRVAYTNTYTVTPVIWQPEIYKEITGRNWNPEDTFKFEIALDPAYGAGTVPSHVTMPADPSVSVGSADQTGGKHGSAFPGIRFHNPGTYKFTITEVSKTDGVTNAPNQEVYVRITDNRDGTLTLEEVNADGTPLTTQEKTETHTFINTYATNDTDTVALQITKTFRGRSWQAADTFEFSLQTTDPATIRAAQDGLITLKNADIPAAADGTLTLETIRISGDGKSETQKKAFSDLVFHSDGNGTAEREYIFTVTEKSGSLTAVRYDTAVYAVTVTVTDDQKGHLTTAVETMKTGGSADPTELAFTNTYAPAVLDGKTELQVFKDLTGREWKEGDRFTFALQTSGKTAEAVENGLVELPEKTEIEILNGESHLAAFANIVFHQTGTYQFQIAENDTNISGMHYDDTVYTLTVDVTAQQDGGLAAAITKVTGQNGTTVFDSGSGQKWTGGVTFKNTYEAPEEPTTSEEPTSPKEEPTSPKEEPTSPKEEPTTPKEEPTTPKEEPTSPQEEPTSPEEPTTLEGPTSSETGTQEETTTGKEITTLPEETTTEEAATPPSTEPTTPGASASGQPPKTGDDSMVEWWILLGLISVAGICFLTGRREREDG